MKLKLFILYWLYVLISELSGYKIPQSINSPCARILSTDVVKPKVSDVEFKLKTPCSTDETYALTELDKIATSKNFDKNKKLVLWINGYLVGLPGTGAEYITEAYRCRGDTNFVATESTNFLKTLYKWSTFNTQAIGQIIAEGLVKLVEEHNYPLENIHVIGHSLGVHIAGNIGRVFKEITNKSLPRITGLDPGNGCYNEGGNPGIHADYADLVDVIYTNILVLGGIEPYGDVTFYVGGLNPMQPGCIDFGCSHIRACEFYAETVYPNNENNFLAVPCPSEDEINSKSCQGEAITMGYNVSATAKGVYYLDANPKSPYGKNAPANADLTSGCSSC